MPAARGLAALPRLRRYRRLGQAARRSAHPALAGVRPLHAALAGATRSRFAQEPLDLGDESVARWQAMGRLQSDEELIVGGLTGDAALATNAVTRPHSDRNESRSEHAPPALDPVGFALWPSALSSFRIPGGMGGAQARIVAVAQCTRPSPVPPAPRSRRNRSISEMSSSPAGRRSSSTIASRRLM